MEVREALQKRRSIRKYKSDMVPQDKLEKIIEAGTYAATGMGKQSPIIDAVSKEQLEELLHAAMSGPSACNRTPWDFYVVTDPEVLKKLREAAKFSKITAPAAIVVCGNLSKALPMQYASYWIQDCSAATENILLAATELGLGSLWCGVHPQKHAEKRIADILGLTNKQIPLNIVYIGHPAEEPEPRDQYKEKNVHWI